MLASAENNVNCFLGLLGVVAFFLLLAWATKRKVHQRPCVYRSVWKTPAFTQHVSAILHPRVLAAGYSAVSQDEGKTVYARHPSQLTLTVSYVLMPQETQVQFAWRFVSGVVPDETMSCMKAQAKVFFDYLDAWVNAPQPPTA
jgi:hypothetical protein